MRFPRRSVELLLVVAVVFHVGVLGALRARTGAVDAYAFQSLDSHEYYDLARNLAEHGAFSRSGAPPYAPDTWRTPGYPLFLALVILVAGTSPPAVIIVQQILAVLSVWLLYRITRRWMMERRAVLVALLFLIEPYHAFYSLWIMATTLFVVVLLLIWYCWERALETKRTHWFAIVGALSGYAVLVRPVAVLLPFALLIGLLWNAWRSRGTDPTRPIAWSTIAVYLAPCILVVGAWMVRTHAVAGRFALSDQDGVVLAYFKSAEVELWREDRTADRYLETSLDPDRADKPHEVWERIDEQLRARFDSLDPKVRDTLRWPNLAQGNRTAVDSFAVSDALADIGWVSLTADPIDTAAFCLLRCGELLTFPIDLALAPPTGVAVDRRVAAGKGVAYAALFLLLAVRLWCRRLPFAQVYFPLASVSALLLATTPQLDPRFRVPMIPMLLFVALLPRSASGSDAVPSIAEPADRADQPWT